MARNTFSLPAGQPGSKHDSLKVAGLFQLALFTNEWWLFLCGVSEILNQDQEIDNLEC